MGILRKCLVLRLIYYVSYVCFVGAAGFPLFDALTIRSSDVETEVHDFMTRDVRLLRSAPCSGKDTDSQSDGKEEVDELATFGGGNSINDSSRDGEWWTRSGCGMRYFRLLGETKWGRDVRVYSRSPLET